MRVPSRFLVAGAALVAFFFIGGCASTDTGTQQKLPPPENLAITCVPFGEVGVVDAALNCTATKNGAAYTDVTYALANVNGAEASISSTGIITPGSSTGNATVTVTDSATGTTATATLPIVNWIVYNQAIDGVANTLVANADGSGTPVQLIANGCYNPQWLHSHLGFVCTSNVPKVSVLQEFMTDGTATGTKLTATLTFTASAIWADLASPSPDGKTVIFRGLTQPGGTTNQYGVFQATLVDGTTTATALEEDEPCGSITCYTMGQPYYNNIGTQVLYGHVVGSESSLNTSLNTMNPDGTGQAEVVNLSPIMVGFGIYSADSSEVFFSEATETTEFGTYVVPSTGGAPSSTPVIAGVFGVVAAPDKNHLAYPAGNGLVVTDINGGHAKTVVTGAGINHPSW